MKTNGYYIMMASLLFMIAACEDEDKIRIPEPQTGVNMRWVVDPEHSVIRYDHAATDVFAFTAFSQNTDLSAVQVTVQYQDQIRVLETLTQVDFVDGQARVEFTANQFAQAFGIPGFADGTEGGNFIFRPVVTLNDGRTYPDYVIVSAQDSFLNLGTGPLGAANGAFTLRINGRITCAPKDISGTYLVVSASGMSTDGCCPDPTTVSGNTVTVTTTSPYVFAVSDITGGLYFEWYDVYGIPSPETSPGNLLFNCDEVGVVDSAEPFGTIFTGDGVYDEAAGRITYTWTNGFADEGTVVLQRQ